jgi:hypothetical protein
METPMKDPVTLSERAFRFAIFLLGLVVLWTGVNVGLGGIATLGLQGSTDFVAATDPARYAVQDSHVRFLGGLWLGLGLLFVTAAWRLRSLRAAVQAALVMVIIGGLARLSAQRFDVLLGPDILGSFVAEVALMPLLLLWSTRVARPTA